MMQIVVMDEASASLDFKADMLIRDFVKTEFSDCTVLTVRAPVPLFNACGAASCSAPCLRCSCSVWRASLSHAVTLAFAC
jgi:hypothetical protein